MNIKHVKGERQATPSLPVTSHSATEATKILAALCAKRHYTVVNGHRHRDITIHEHFNVHNFLNILFWIEKRKCQNNSLIQKSPATSLLAAGVVMELSTAEVL